MAIKLSQELLEANMPCPLGHDNQMETAVDVTNIFLLVDNNGLSVNLSDLVLLSSGNVNNSVHGQSLRQANYQDIPAYVGGEGYVSAVAGGDQTTSTVDHDNQFETAVNETKVVFLVDNNGSAFNWSDLVYMPGGEMTSSVDEQVENQQRDHDFVVDTVEEHDDDDYYVILDSIDDEPSMNNEETAASAPNEHLEESSTKDKKSVYVNVCKREDGNRAYNKELCCFFCKQLLKLKIQRHFTTVHKKEPEVLRILSKPQIEQDLLFTSLKHRGNFNHNVEVLERGVRELIVCRRPSTATQADEYLPCVHCLGFFLSMNLYAHNGQCKFNLNASPTPKATESEENTKHSKNVLGKARMFLAGTLHQDFAEMSDSFRSDIVDTMRVDELSKYVQTDSLIIKYGATLYRRHGKTRCHDISQKMRLLARLVLSVRQGRYAGQYPNLESLITGAAFDCVIETTEQLCQLEENELGRPLFKNPTLGLNMGHILVKIAEIKRGMGIRNSIRSYIDDADAFLNLHKADWTNHISSASLATFKHRK